MRIGIRSKLVVFLAAGALLPLVGALVAIISGETSVRMRSVEQSLLAVAVSEAELLQTALIGDLKQLNVTVGKPTITNALREAVGPLPFAEIQRIEGSWADLAPEDRLLASVLDGPGAQALQLLRKTNSHFAEVFITNRFGELVTTTNKTSDFFQADEEWWQGAFYAGKGRVLIPQISYDISSQVWSIDLCIPIYSGSELVGIGKAVVDVGLLLGNLRQPVGMLEASILLAQENGEITYPERGVLPKLTVDEWAGEIAEGKRPGIRTTRAGELQAFVPISIAEAIVGGEVQMPRWTLVLYTRRADALSSVYRVVGGALAIGLASIAILFLAALYLFDRNIVRRVLHVAAVARRVAKGDLSSRVSPRRSRDKFLGEDEIDDLSRSFDHMISEVERSYQQLAMANELKQNFIQVAGHELRTPIAYMLGMSRLLRDNDDPSRLSEALRTIGTKAERLNRIVQALFKLMPEGVLSHELRYEEFEVAAVLEEIREEVRPFLEKRRQTLAIETPAVLPRLEADRQKIFDVLENLVMNAIKFSPDGAEVRIRVEPQDSDCLRFVVIDQGQGIAPEDLPHLFQPFFSGRHVLTHSTGEIAYQKRGMGLGLAVVRFFVELHRGTVQVATGPQGSSFSFTLPILAPSGQSTSLAYQI